MTAAVYGQLLRDILDGGMLCVGRVANLMHYAMQCSVLPGEMVEFGCHSGRTSALLTALVDKPIWLYDSFEGLPDRLPQDEGSLAHFKCGTLAVSMDEVKARFARFKLLPPVIHKGWFSEVPPERLPERICFAHLDGDMYESIRASLVRVYPRLVSGAACVIDDYGWSGTSGVKIAVDEFFKFKREHVCPLVTGSAASFQAVIVKF
jgi:O-methyltransferase